MAGNRSSTARFISNITFFQGTSQVWHLKTTTEVERQRWITTLELARAGKPNLESGTDNTDSDSDEDDPNHGPDLKQLQSKLEDLQTCHDLIKKHSTSLSRVVNDLGKLYGVSELDRFIVFVINYKLNKKVF